MPKTVLAIVPHPDDAEMEAGGLLVKYARGGHRVVFVVATDGSRGSMDRGGPALAARREGETRRAAALIGAAEPIFLGWPDFGLDSIPLPFIREKLISLIRTMKPDLVITQDPAVYDSHPDHRTLAIAAADAIEFSMLPGIHPEQIDAGLEPWFVAEKLFYSKTNAGANYFVDISDVIGVKVDAVLEHQSQVEFLVADIMRQAELACIKPEAMAAASGTGASGPEGPAALMAWAVQRRAAEIGAKAGYPFGEAYRRVRFHPYVEGLANATDLACEDGEGIEELEGPSG